jgi:hypothetical protein
MTRLPPDQIRRNGDGDTRLLSPAELDEAMKDAARMADWLAKDDEPPYRLLWPVAGGVVLFAVLVMIGKAML